MFNFFNKNKETNNYLTKFNEPINRNVLTNKEIMTNCDVYLKIYYEHKYSNLTVVQDKEMITAFYNHLKQSIIGTSFYSDLKLGNSSIYLNMDDNEKNSFYTKDSLDSYEEMYKIAIDKIKFEQNPCNEECVKCKLKPCIKPSHIFLLDKCKAVISFVRFNDTGHVKPVTLYNDYYYKEYFNEEYFFMNEFRYFYDKYKLNTGCNINI